MAEGTLARHYEICFIQHVRGLITFQIQDIFPLYCTFTGLPLVITFTFARE